LAGSPAHAGSLGPVPRGPGASARIEPTASRYDYEGAPWPGPPTPLFASPDGDPYGEVRAPSGRGRGLKAGTIWVIAAFVVVYAGAVAVHRFQGASSLSPSGSSKSVQGTIGSNAALRANGSTPPATSIASLPPSVSTTQALPSDTVAPPPQADVEPVQPPRRVSPAQAQPQASVAPVQPQPVQPQTRTQTQTQTQLQPSGEEDAYASGRSAPSAQAHGAQAPDSQAANAPQPYRARRGEAQSGRAAAYRALSTAQTQFGKSDLSGARASLNRALAADPRNGEALGLRDALSSREQERDAALSAAHACVEQSRWTCVWHYAGQALAVDASSTEARTLVNRAIVESGAATAPAGPGPDNVEVPMVQ
jgi:hypothetical protein